LLRCGAPPAAGQPAQYRGLEEHKHDACGGQGLLWGTQSAQEPAAEGGGAGAAVGGGGAGGGVRGAQQCDSGYVGRGCLWALW
jgi:hypothetical protein